MAEETEVGEPGGKTGEEHREYWFEFFYDLVLAAALASMHDAFLKNFTVQTAVITGSVAAILFTIWLLTTLQMNRFPRRQPFRRLALLVQMAAMVVVALTADRSSGIPLNAGLIAYVIALLTVAFLYWQSLPQMPVPRARVQRRIVGFLALAAIVVSLAVWLPPSFALPVLYVALAISVISMGLGYPSPSEEYHNVDIGHLNERLGAFILIVIGMAFAQLVVDLNGLQGLPDWRFFALVFVLMFTLWWMYFGLGVHERRYATSRFRFVWIAGHYLILIGVVGMTDVLTALAADRESVVAQIGIAYLGLMAASVLLGFAVFMLMIQGLGVRAAIGLASLALLALTYGVVVERTSHHGLRVASTVVVLGLVLGAVGLAIATHRGRPRSRLRLR